MEQAVTEPACFDVEKYLKERTEEDTFVMVEFGHDAHPIAYQQSVNLTGNRAYIGYEAWLRDPRSIKRSNLLQEHETSEARSLNIHYQTLALGGVARYVQEDGNNERWLEGEYNPSTPLPDNSVEEVVLGNVFGDPDIAESSDRTIVLLEEANRIITNEGIIIIRETISPRRTSAHLPDSIEALGLTVMSRILPTDKSWCLLEQQFAADTSYAKDSFYLLLSKRPNSAQTALRRPANSPRSTTP